MKTAPKALFATFTVFFLCSACSTEGKDPVDPHDGAEVTFSTYSYDDETGEAEALFEGKLHDPNDGGRVYGERHEGTQFGMVFPEGTTYSTDSDVLKSPAQVEILIDEDVSLGGGYYDASSGDDNQGDFDEYFYVNSVDGESIR